MCLRPRDRFWDIPAPKIDSAFDNLFVPQPSWSPRLDAYFASPLALCARRVSSAASRLLGSTSLRFALHGWQRMHGPVAADHLLDTFEEKGWMLADHPALGQERPDIAVDSACWHPPAADGGHRLNTETLRARQQYPAPRFMVPLPRLDSYSQRYLPNTGRITAGR
ncbi:hypothetical protein, partial [Thiolapillus sp.]